MDLLPSELMRNSMEAYIDEHPTHSQKIYWFVLIVVTVAILSLPFIYVDVSVQDTGFIRPVAEKTEIKSTLTEFIDSTYVKEGWRICRGDTILTFRSSNPNYKIDYQQNRIDDFRKHLKDLRYLAAGTPPPVFSSETRRQEYVYYSKQRIEAETTLGKTRKDYQRNQSLFDKGVVSAEEFEKYEYEYLKAKNELSSLKENQVSKWQSDLNTYDNSYNEMLASLKQEKKDKDSYVILSPVNGTLEQFRGLYKGGTVQTGATIAVISPDSTLFCETYVSPRHIGYLYPDMPVKIQVESFNYNEWGIISGKVTDISSDFFTDDGNGDAFYKVKCRMDRNYLVRKNGIRGNLKKGMTVVTHFMITRRSLFDLLYQKVDDWANPTQYAANPLTKEEQ